MEVRFDAPDFGMVGSLNVASLWQIPVGSGYLYADLGIMGAGARQAEGLLDESFAKGSFSNNGGAMVVLESTGDDFGGGGGSIGGEDNHGPTGTGVWAD